MNAVPTVVAFDHGAKVGCPSIAQHIVGHGDDRSPDREVESKVSREHYDLAEDRILHALTTLPLPPSFAAPIFADRDPRGRIAA